MIIREEYISKVRGFYGSDLVKIITGVRRCGKSIILEQIMEELSKQSDNVLYTVLQKKKLMKGSSVHSMV